MSAERNNQGIATHKKTIIVEAASSLSGSNNPTVAAPSYAPPAWKKQPQQLKAGDKVGDFEILRELGRGGFATVFLARQISLGRNVALKVGPNRGREAQTLASLEHDHIVHVFSETLDAHQETRLLCMQYIPGATLADVLDQFQLPDRHQGNGGDFLAALDRVSKQSDEFRPGAMQERQAIAESSFFEALCLIGAKLSSALEFAHDQGILHRDIKPANILINPYGRPFLADFNLASHTSSDTDVVVGGTLPYMAPEHLQAFIDQHQDAWNKVDVRSDIYSLGVVLYELATGKRPYPSNIKNPAAGREAMEELLEQRRQAVSTLASELPGMLDVIIRTCLSPDPLKRYACAAELRQALESCRQHLRSLQQLPAPPWWTRYFHQHPFISLLIIPTVTNILATAVNWSYNLIQIVGDFSSAQQTAFNWLVVIYNTIAFPVLVGITAWLLHHRHREWTSMDDGRLVSPDQLVPLRHRINFLATWSILGSLIGWLPAGLIFPMTVHWFGEPITTEQFLHFVLSFILSGMIAVTYCYLGSQYVVLRVLLPRLCGISDQQDSTLGRELRRLPFRLMLFQVLAGVIPLTGALMIVMISATHGGNSFRVLVCLLIVFGMVGFVFALQLTHYLQNVLNILLNPEQRRNNS